MLDLKTEKGKEVFWKLLEDADVVVENNRAGAMERMGLGYEDIKKRRPDIIYASMEHLRLRRSMDRPRRMGAAGASHHRHHRCAKEDVMELPPSFTTR